MELEKQVVSLELAKKLKELGVEQNSLFYWNHNSEGTNISAFTVAELGEILPTDLNCLSYFTIKEKFIDKVGNKHTDYFFNYKGVYNENKATGECTVQKILTGSQSKNEADARAKMLIYLKENKII